MVKKTRISQGPLLLDGLLGAKMTSMLKIKNFSKSSYGVNVKVHINHQKTFCKVHSVQISSVLKFINVIVLESSSLGHSRQEFLENFENLQN